MISRILTLLFLLFICFYINGQNYKKYYSKVKHTNEVILIATGDSLFATGSSDKSVIIWNYKGEIIYRFYSADIKINSLAFIPKTNFLLIGITEFKDNVAQRYIIKCLNGNGKEEYELIDKRLPQEYTNLLFEDNVTGVRNAIRSVNNAFPELNIKNTIEVPQVDKKTSHIELVQSITVSPDQRNIASIDKFNILKIWDQNKEIQQTIKIINNKKDTHIYFCTDSTIFIEPNIFLNIRDTSTQVVKGFERYSSIPFNSSVYFHFNYNDESRPEKMYNMENSSIKTFDFNNYYTITGAKSFDKIALLGIDGLIRVINKEGELLSTFGKDRNELMTFRGEKIRLFSKISSIGFSPNGKHLVSGDENGRVIIWRYE